MYKNSHNIELKKNECQADSHDSYENTVNETPFSYGEECCGYDEQHVCCHPTIGQRDCGIDTCHDMTDTLHLSKEEEFSKKCEESERKLIEELKKLAEADNETCCGNLENLDPIDRIRRLERINKILFTILLFLKNDVNKLTKEYKIDWTINTLMESTLIFKQDSETGLVMLNTDESLASVDDGDRKKLVLNSDGDTIGLIGEEGERKVSVITDEWNAEI